MAVSSKLCLPPGPLPHSARSVVARYGGPAERCKLLELARRIGADPGAAVAEARVDLLVAEAQLRCADAEPDLLAIVRGKGGQRERILALGGLGLLGSKKVTADAIKLLGSDKPRTQRAAARALGMLADPAAIKPLVNYAGTPDAFTPARVAAMDALATLRAAPAVTLATLLVSCSKPAIARAALRLLTAVPSPRARPAVAYGQRTPGLRTAAAAAVAKARDDRLTDELLRAAAGDKWPRKARSAAFTALGQLKPNGAAATLVGRLAKADDNERQELLKVVAKLGDRTVVPNLVRYLPQAEPQVAKFVIYALEKLTGKRLGMNPDAWFQHAGLEPDGSRSPR